MPALIPAVDDPALERRLRDRVVERTPVGDDFGELAELGVRLGLMLGTEEPRLKRPQLLLFAADHGIAVDGVAPPGCPTTAQCVQGLLSGAWPLAGIARTLGLPLTVVDAGIADRLPALNGLSTRKIAHGTRNARAGAAMTLVQTQAAFRAGMEMAETTPGNLVACAGLGVGSAESAALVLSRLWDAPFEDLACGGPSMEAGRLAHLKLVAQGAHNRHPAVRDPVEVLAAFGGFEIAMMAGLMLGAARRRVVLLVDGWAACAALQVARQVDSGVAHFAMLCTSRRHHGLERALERAGSLRLPCPQVDSIDGTAAALAWPRLAAAAELLRNRPAETARNSDFSALRLDPVG